MNEPALLSYTSKTKQAQEKLARDVRAALDDAEALVRVTASHAGEGLAEASSRAKESLAHARVQLEKVQAIASERTHAAASAVDEYVHAKPWGALGVAAVVGVAIGLLVGRR